LPFSSVVIAMSTSDEAITMLEWRGDRIFRERVFYNAAKK
jgi:hypothetical protein